MGARVSINITAESVFESAASRAGECAERRTAGLVSKPEECAEWTQEKSDKYFRIIID